MAKIKLTKGELKRQRDALKQFQHYLPTLQLKKQQLQMKLLEVRRNLEAKEKAVAGVSRAVESWSGLFDDPEINPGLPPEEAREETKGFYLQEWIVPENVSVEEMNVAGADIPIFKSVQFKQTEYDLYVTPFWVDKAIEKLREMVSLLVEIDVIRKQEEILKHELRVTTQRVNLFEKVKIPECLENIRRIRIYLGDLQANAVGIGKVAKKKIEERELISVDG